MINIEFIKVINPVEPIVTTKDEDGAVVDHCNVSIPRGRRHVICNDLIPNITLYVIPKEIILPCNSIIPTKYVNVVLERDACVK